MNINEIINTSSIIDDFEKKIIDEFKLLKIDVPIVQKFDINSDYINFDNKYNNQVYQIMETFDDYYVWFLNDLDQYDGIFNRFFLINRNSLLDDSNSIVEYYYELCIKNIWSNNNFQDLIIKIEKIVLDFFNISYKNIKFKNFSNYNKKIIHMNIDDYLYQDVHNHKILNVINVDSKLINKENSSFFDNNLFTTLLFWNNIQNNVIPLISFSFMNYDKKSSKIKQPFIKVKINFSKLLMIYFKKSNINELLFYKE